VACKFPDKYKTRDFLEDKDLNFPFFKSQEIMKSTINNEKIDVSKLMKSYKRVCNYIQSHDKNYPCVEIDEMLRFCIPYYIGIFCMAGFFGEFS
jgi:hypothetical protein